MKPLKDVTVTRRRAAFWIGISPALLTFRVARSAAQSNDAVPPLKMPLKDGSFRFAVMGDTGRGDSGQYGMAKQMEATHKVFPYDLVIMVGDNIYGADGPADMLRKFDTPYKPLVDAGVKFQAALGNHDNPNQRFYKSFNMGDKRFYTFRPAKTTDIRFFAIDTNYVDKEQTDWLEKELASSTSDWKIPFYHHPLYSSGRTHGSALETRAVLEPIFVKHGVSVAFAGHDHIYERTKPQKGGIVHWVCGAGGSLRKGDLRPSEMTAKGFDTDYHFLIGEISGDELYFQAISRTGSTIDSGVIKKIAGTTTVTAPSNATPAPTKPATDAPTPGTNRQGIVAPPRPSPSTHPNGALS